MKKLTGAMLALGAASLCAANVLAASSHAAQAAANGAGALAAGNVSASATLQGQGVDLAALPSHAAAVVEAAQDRDLTGGKNDNHGGAVSLAARPSPSPTSTATASTAPLASAATSPSTSPSNHGSVVSAVARDHDATGGKNNNHGGAVSTVARASASPTATTVAPPTPASPAGAGPSAAGHGSTVSAAAQDPDLTGGKNDNHGGAVSNVARPSPTH